MSILTRNTPARFDRRDISSLPWINGTTVPSPLQDAAGGYRYNPVDVFKIAAAIACIGLRSGALVQMPLKGYSDAGGFPQPLDIQPDLLRTPSMIAMPSIWKAQMSISRDVWGYAAGRITAVDAAGYTKHVEWLPPDRVKAKQTQIGGALEWSVAGNPVDASLIFHVPSRWVTPGSPLGMSPLEQSGLISLAKRVQDYGRDWFERGGTPSAILYSDQALTSDEADGILARIMARWSRRQPGVLGSGLKYESVSANAADSQYLETAVRLAADVAISFNMQPDRIGAAITGASLTYQNRDQSNQQWLVDSINPDLVVVQEYIGAHMKPSTYPRFQTGALLRSDLKTRYEVGAIGIKSHFITPNEVRGWEELPPLTDEQLASMPTVYDVAPTAHTVNVNQAAAPQPRQADTYVDVQPTVVNVPAPTVNVDVAPTVVNVPATEVVIRNEMPEPRVTTMTRTVERDPDGRILRLIDETL